MTTERQDVSLDELQTKAEKLLLLLKHREPGLFTWHEFLHENLEDLHDLIPRALGK